MQKDKSKIKEVWRCDELRPSLHWVPEWLEGIQEAGVVPFASDVKTVFEDGSVRFSQGGVASSGAALYEMFAGSVASHFASFPNCHTFILAFDDRRHVPARKATTQSSRRQALEASSSRRHVPEWHWDGVSPIVINDPTRALPPWERLRLDRRAYARALSDLVDIIVRTYRPPAGRRLIVDEGHRIFIVESSLDNRVAEPYDIIASSRKPAIGEADMSAQWYASAARRGVLTCGRPSTTLKERAPLIDVASSNYYGAEMSATPIEWRSKPQQEISVNLFRDHYEAGSVLLRSTDTDFVVLSLAWFSSVVHHNVYVSLGRIHVDSANKVVPSSKDAVRPHWEYVDIGAMVKCLGHFNASPWCFAAFCTSCGNDYVKRMGGFSHSSMFTGFRRWCQLNTPLVRVVTMGERHIPVATLDDRAFSSLLHHCYYTRLNDTRRPASLPPWSALATFVRDAHSVEDRHMPNADKLLEYYEQVAWSLVYASTAPHGAEFLP